MPQWDEEDGSELSDEEADFVVYAAITPSKFRPRYLVELTLEAAQDMCRVTEKFIRGLYVFNMADLVYQDQERAKKRMAEEADRFLTDVLGGVNDASSRSTE